MRLRAAFCRNQLFSALLAAYFTLSAARSAWAASPLVRFEYRTSAACPDKQEFLARVRRRLKHASIAESSALARVFTVTARSGHPDSVGQVEFLDENGERVARVVSGATCDEVISGIALVSALVIDARAESADAERALLNDAARHSKEVANPPLALRRYGFGVGTAAGLESWLGPKLGYSLQGFGEMSSVPLVSRIRIGALRGRSSAKVDDRGVELNMLAARVAVCPISFGIASGLALTTCLSADFGQLEAETQQASSLAWVHTARIFWAAAELRPGIRWVLGRALALEATGELGFPLVRHTFVFDEPRQVVFEIPALGVGAEFGMSAQF